MSKISGAIHEFQTIDGMAAKDQWMNRIHPLVKFALTIFYIILVVSFPKYDLAGLIRFMVYPVVLFVVGDIAFLDSLRRIRVVLLLVCVVGILNPFFDRSVIGTIGSVTITGGMVSMLTLMLKGILSVLASYLLIVTTSIEKICYAMRLLHIPKLFTTQILLIYRYISVLMIEAERITQAYALRAPKQKGVHFKVWGSLVGLLLFRSMDRAEDIYESMCLRGYQGEFTYGSRIKCRGADWLYLLIWLVILVVLRSSLLV